MRGNVLSPLISGLLRWGLAVDGVHGHHRKYGELLEGCRGHLNHPSFRNIASEFVHLMRIRRREPGCLANEASRDPTFKKPLVSFDYKMVSRTE